MADYLLQFTITFADATTYTGTIDVTDRSNRARAISDATDDINATLWKYAHGRVAVGIAALDATRPTIPG